MTNESKFMVGDEVAKFDSMSRFRGWFTVSRVRAFKRRTKITLSDGSHFDDHGYEWDYHGYSSDHIEPAAPDVKARVGAELARRRLERWAFKELGQAPDELVALLVKTIQEYDPKG